MSVPRIKKDDENTLCDPNFLVSISVKESEIYTGIKFEPIDSETQFYLEENLYGVLVPTLQQLLILLDARKDIIDDDVMINPLNWLAMQIMRNNVKHNDELKGHPYFKLLNEHVNSRRRKEKRQLEDMNRKKEAKQVAEKEALEEQKQTEQRQLEAENKRKEFEIDRAKGDEERRIKEEDERRQKQNEETVKRREEKKLRIQLEQKQQKLHAEKEKKDFFLQKLSLDALSVTNRDDLDKFYSKVRVTIFVIEKIS